MIRSTRLLRPCLTMTLAVVLLPGLLAAGARAQEAPPEALPGVGLAVDTVLDDYSDGLSELYLDEKLTGSARKAAEESLKDAARKTLRELVLQHRPGGSGPRRDLTEAYEALLSPSFVPKSEAARALVVDLLSADPGTAGAWTVATRLRGAEVLGVQEDAVAAAGGLRSWATGVAGRLPEGSSAAAAIRLLVARLELDMGNAQGAAQAAQRIVALQAGGTAVVEAARSLVVEAKRLPAGFAAPPFTLPRKGDGAELTLARLAGRATCVLLRFDDAVGADLEHFAYSLTSRIPSHELAVVVIPVGGEIEEVTEMTNPDLTGWHVAEAGAANADIADAYRAGGRSALFLLGPDAKILESSRWDLPDATERVQAHIRSSLGRPLEEVLKSAARSTSWERFRELWRKLARGRRAVDSPEAMEQALEAGQRAVYALMLAGDASGHPVAYPYETPPGTLHGNLVVSWCGRATEAGRARWSELTAPLLLPKDAGALALADALYDLGLAGGTVRERLEVAAGKATDWRTASMALRALSFADAGVLPETLPRRARHKQWQVRLALAEALIGYRCVESVEALIALLGDKRLRVRAAAAVSLADLTGTDFGVAQAEWAKWRREQGTGLRVQPRSGGIEAGAADAHRYAAGGYFGLKITSNRVVFVLDKSESMYYGLWDAAVDEMELFLTTAGPTTSFALVEFDAEPRVWKKRLSPANPRTVRGAVDWLQRARPYGPTNVMDSLDLGFDVKDVDTVVLLSDGLPNRGAATEPQEILRTVVAENRYTRLAIHAVWMARGRMFEHDGPRGKDKPPLDDAEKARRKRIREGAGAHPLGGFLMELARQHDGTFGVAFGDMYRPPPGTGTRPSTDR